jgi:hypothetical protein
VQRGRGRPSAGWLGRLRRARRHQQLKPRSARGLHGSSSTRGRSPSASTRALLSPRRHEGRRSRPARGGAAASGVGWSYLASCSDPQLDGGDVPRRDCAAPASARQPRTQREGLGQVQAPSALGPAWLGLLNRSPELLVFTLVSRLFCAIPPSRGDRTAHHECFAPRSCIAGLLAWAFLRQQPVSTRTWRALLSRTHTRDEGYFPSRGAGRRLGVRPPLNGHLRARAAGLVLLAAVIAC